MTRWSVGVCGALVLAALTVVGTTVEPPFAPGVREVRADVAVVMSGDVDYLRVARAADLYVRGGAARLLVTGAGIGGDDARELGRQAVDRGVRAEDVVIEPTSTSTRENVVQAATIVRARGWRTVALVTSVSHMNRALGAARKAAPEVKWIPVPVEDAGPESRRRRARLSEWVKLAWYKARGWI
jgi:uncharacterized SAM-binding protein YcdF (DUF218 family)